MKVLRTLRTILLPLLAALLTTVLIAGLLLAAPGTHSRLGQTLALRASLHSLAPALAPAKTFQDFGVPTNLHRGSDGRYIYSKPDLMRAGAVLRSRAAGTVTPQVNEAVQTFDVFNPPPAFALAAGQSLTPTNLTPVWTSDETMLIFSSNRTATGTAGTRFHIWAVPINGGTPMQLTASTGPVNGGEFFPALSNNQQLAFTSDANTAGVQNLYSIPFAAKTVSVNGLLSPTFQGVDANGNSLTGIGGVGRPTFSPANADEIIFSALSTSGASAGHQHLYFLYQSTKGYNPNAASLPAKLTDGPADDTDPNFSQDGQFIAFASTASTLTASNVAPSADPNVAPIHTAVAAGTTEQSNRAIFLISGADGVTNGGAPVTAPGTDNFGPAWSSTQRNPYLNPTAGQEYIAFSRGAAQASPHDIVYLNVLQNTNAGGESGRSNEASSTPLTPTSPVFQVNAGDTTQGENFGGYVADTFINPLTTRASFTVNGGTADQPATPPIVFNTTADPGTPPQIYQTDRSGTFTYTFPNLTPNATYLVRLHLADTKDTAAGKRVFNVTVNGSTTEGNIDIVGTALQSPGRLDGLVTDASTGTALPGASVTITQAAPSTFASTLTSAATATPDPNPAGTGTVNYNGPLPQGTYTVTVSAANYGSVSRIVDINSGAYTRADFALSPGSGTFSGTVSDTSGNGVSGVTLSVTDAATGATVATNPSPITTGGTGAYGPVTLAPGSYYITATPTPGNGFTTQTQPLTITSGMASTLPFTLQNKAAGNVGTLGGLITDATTKAQLTGATVTVLGANKTVVAILTTGMVSSTPAPNGDGNPVNYQANLPVGTYTLQFSEPGYTSVTTQVNVVNTPAAGTTAAVSFVRADQPLSTASATVGPNTAIVVEYTVTVPSFDQTDKNGLVIAPRGAITLAFNPVSGDPPIVQGIEILSDPNPSTSSGFGSLGNINNSAGASAAPEISVLGGEATDVNGNPIMPGTPINTVTLFNFGSGTPSSYNIYRSPAFPNSSNEPPASGAGTELGTVYANIPANGGFATFPDTGVAFGSEYYYQATAVYQEILAPESATNPVVQLNTNDPGHVYVNAYPTWSPFLSVFSIAYSSNRTITYTDPATGTASETAISIGQNGSLGNGGTVGANYAGLLESQVVNLDPPTLVPYSGDEIVHVNTGPGYTAASSTRIGVTPGQPATFTVRLSSREAGVDDGNIYLQIKDPDSKYQDAQGLEHKVFAHDAAYRSQRNNPNLGHLDSGSSDILMNGGGYSGFNQFSINGRNLGFPQRGAVGGIDGPESQTGGGAAPGPNGNKSDTISIGRDGGIGTATNTAAVLDAKGVPILDANKNIAVLPGGDPSLFIPTGPEFECQAVNPNFSLAGPDTLPSDYTDPYWLAGVDDQQPFSGVTNPKSANNKLRPPTEWLKMARLPAAQQDGHGGILYSVTWKTPTSASDYYLDVIAFDKAVAPTSATNNERGSNWRIYDNVWGFSTNSSIGSNDILLVSDYTLGQKFAATTFGGQRGLLNLVPKLYGAESYVTDIDDSLLPNAIFRYAVYPGADPNRPQQEVLDLGTAYDSMDQPNGSPGNAPYPVRNGLGVNSYTDRFINDGGQVDGAPAVRSQMYSIWRTLARGPVPASLYAAYEPTLQSQPAVSDAGGAAPVAVAAGTVPVANRCIVWISPFTGDVLAGPGTLADPNTQASLRAFVAAGGRLCISGQDVGSALTQSGTVNNAPGGFLSDVLNATLVSANQGTHLPMGGTDTVNNRISNIPSYDGELQGAYQEIVPSFESLTTSISQRPIRISNNYDGNIFETAFDFNPGYAGNWRTDGSLDQLGPYIQGFPEQSNNTNSVVGQIDTIKPNAGPNVHTDITLGAFANPIPLVDNGNDNAASAPGGIGLIYSENPITAAGGTGSKVVYATFGLEALSTEYYKQTNTNAAKSIAYFARNQRQNILHNIVSYLRTGTISGTIRVTTGNNTVGAGIPNATVYVQSAYGPAIPGRGTFSALTDQAGNYSLGGLEPGNYTLVAYKTGYNRAVSNPGTVLTVEGDSTIAGANLSLVQGASGTITGVVTDSSSKPVANASVTFTTSDGTSQAAPPTDANGVYTLANVPPGTYTGTAVASGASATSPPETVTSGVTLTVNFKLSPGAGGATGRVVDTAAVPAPIVGATVFFNGGGLATPAKATTDSTGTYTFPSGSLPAGSYSVTATAPGFGASIPASIPVVITSSVVTPVQDIALGPASNGTLGGLVTATGNSTPLGGVTITIVNAATGVAVTPATTTSAAATAAPDGSGSINYGPVTLPSGSYSVTASVNGVTTASQTASVPANGFARLDFTGVSGLPPVHVFPAGIQFVSAPYDYSGIGFNGLFGALGVNRTNVAVWNPLVGAYALDPNPPADTIHPGIGYWVDLKSATPVTQTGTPLTGSVTVALNPVWNQIGVPSTTGVAVSSLTFTGTDGVPRSFADATGSTYHLVSPILYSYDGTTYQPVSAGATLQPWQAYWIRVFTPVTMSIPTGK